MLKTLRRPFNDETMSLLSWDHRKHLDKFADHLRRFLDGIPEMADSLAEVSQKGLLSQFLAKGHTRIDETFKDSKLVSNSTIDDDYKDLPLLLAFAHEGGNLWDLVGRKNSNGDPHIDGLIERLLSMSPQQFISTSGLLAGAKSAQMYVDLVGQLIEKHSSIMGSLIKNGMMDKEKLGLLWFSKMETVSGVISTDETLTLLMDSRSLKAKNAGLDEFDLEDYKHLLNECGVNVSNVLMENREQKFDSIFLADAFVLLHTHQDTKAVIKNLTLKASVWAGLMINGRSDYACIPHKWVERMVEQMLAAACFAHPEHFHRAGFSINNLATPHESDATFRDVNSLMAGPLAYCSLSKKATKLIDKKFGEIRLFEYARRLVPGFDLEKLITQSGFTNRTIPALVENIGGHHPVIDEALEGCKISKVVASDMIKMLIKNKAFGSYLPSTLIRICEGKLHDLAYRNAEGELVHYSNLENPENFSKVSVMNIRRIEETRDQLFLPAYAQNPEFKQAMIEHLIAQPGITAKHLTMTGIDPDDNPEILIKMHLLDRGQTFHNALGI